MPEGFDAFVLTGGRSARMGRDKALVEIDGQPMAARVARALADAGAARVVCVGGDLAGLRAFGLIAEPDELEGSGPLGGVLSALALSGEPVAVIAPCDLLTPTAAAMRLLVAGLRGRDDASVSVPRVDGRWRPLPCAVRRESRTVLAQAFAAGDRAVHVAMERLPRVELDVGPLDDADAPEDLPDRR